MKMRAKNGRRSLKILMETAIGVLVLSVAAALLMAQTPGSFTATGAMNCIMEKGLSAALPLLSVGMTGTDSGARVRYPSTDLL